MRLRSVSRGGGWNTGAVSNQQPAYYLTGMWSTLIEALGGRDGCEEDQVEVRLQEREKERECVCKRAIERKTQRVAR